MVRDGSMIGAVVMWSGNALLLGLCIMFFVKLRRN
jgi:hypothetical protein